MGSTVNAPHGHELDGNSSRPTGPRTFVAGHVNSAFQARIDMCAGMIGDLAAPQHFAHFSGTVRDFSIDTLASLSADRYPPDGSPDLLLRLGQQLCLLFGSLEENLADVRSGGLIRLVVHAARGACYCDQIVPGQIAVGTRFEDSGPDRHVADRAGVWAADKLLAELTTDIRRSLRQGSENPGGFEPKACDEQPRSESLWIEDALGDQVTEAFLAAAADAVAGTSLHYVALCRDAEILAVVDRLENPELGGYFTQMTIGARRAFYADFARGLGFLAGRVGRMSRPVLEGPLHRMVFDVQQGALYYYRLRTDMYLLGVTLDQSEVASADDRVAELALSCAQLVDP